MATDGIRLEMPNVQDYVSVVLEAAHNASQWIRHCGLENPFPNMFKIPAGIAGVYKAGIEASEAYTDSSWSQAGKAALTATHAVANITTGLADFIKTGVAGMYLELVDSALDLGEGVYELGEMCMVSRKPVETKADGVTTDAATSKEPVDAPESAGRVTGTIAYNLLKVAKIVAYIALAALAFVAVAGLATVSSLLLLQVATGALALKVGLMTADYCAGKKVQDKENLQKECSDLEDKVGSLQKALSDLGDEIASKKMAISKKTSEIGAELGEVKALTEQTTALAAKTAFLGTFIAELCEKEKLHGELTRELEEVQKTLEQKRADLESKPEETGSKEEVTSVETDTSKTENSGVVGVEEGKAVKTA